MSAPNQNRPAGAPKVRDWPKHLIILFVLGIELLPLYMMLQISGKNNLMFTENPWLPARLGEWQWENYLFAFELIAPAVANSIFITVSTTVLTLFVALLGAYFFARYKMPFSNFLWAVFLFLMLMPGVANIVPLFMLIKSMNLLNTLWALVIIGISGAQVFNIYILRNFIEDLPKDLFEAAEIDGAGHFKQLLHIVIPMSGPIIGTLAILSFLTSWNEFLMPLIFLKDSELFPIGVALIYLDGEYVKQWGAIMATFLLASIPLIILFLFTMKLFVRGLSSGAVKG
ncbi:MAG: carbohydrate ABC transporter permease [Opitutales bacterium]|nr:carbohydrate ABC transporter permease [Opitutales bacterium]